MALAHTVGDSVEQAYVRTDLYDQRTELMQQWAAHATNSDQRGTAVHDSWVPKCGLNWEYSRTRELGYPCCYRSSPWASRPANPCWVAE